MVQPRRDRQRLPAPTDSVHEEGPRWPPPGDLRASALSRGSQPLQFAPLNDVLPTLTKAFDSSGPFDGDFFNIHLRPIASFLTRTCSRGLFTVCAICRRELALV